MMSNIRELSWVKGYLNEVGRKQIMLTIGELLLG